MNKYKTVSWSSHVFNDNLYTWKDYLYTETEPLNFIGFFGGFFVVVFFCFFFFGGGGVFFCQWQTCRIIISYVPLAVFECSCRCFSQIASTKSICKLQPCNSIYIRAKISLPLKANGRSPYAAAKT